MRKNGFRENYFEGTLFENNLRLVKSTPKVQNLFIYLFILSYRLYVKIKPGFDVLELDNQGIHEVYP